MVIFYLLVENLFFVSARTQCIYSVLDLWSSGSTMCFVHDCKVHLLRFSLSMHMHIHVHFTDTTTEFLITVGVRYN